MADETKKVDVAQVTEDAVEVGSAIAANPKGFWKSKTFWFNAILAATHYFGFLPPQATVPVGIAGNVALRLISSQPVSITGK